MTLGLIVAIFALAGALTLLLSLLDNLIDHVRHPERMSARQAYEERCRAYQQHYARYGHTDDWWNSLPDHS